MHRFAIIIPARFASTRFPGKPLVPLRGAGGIAKSLIERTWECASAVPGCAGVWVATDDGRIASEVERFGGQVVMTSPTCANGTERCAEAVERIGDVAEFVVNLQGDAPLSPSAVVNRLIDRLIDNQEVAMATPAISCSPSTYRHLLADRAAGRVGGTTVVFTDAYRALYFSKEVIPFAPGGLEAASLPVPVHLHLGLYAYRPEALNRYRQAPMSRLEQLEGLEQLRFLELGMPISVVEIEPLSWDPIELNNPDDVTIIERTLASRGIQ